MIRKLKILGDKDSLEKNINNFLLILELASTQINKFEALTVSIYLPADTTKGSFPWLNSVLSQKLSDKLIITCKPFPKDDSHLQQNMNYPFPIIHTIIEEKIVYAFVADINKIPEELQPFMDDLCPWGSAFLNCRLL